jgi:hypothetical protein
MQLTRALAQHMKQGPAAGATRTLEVEVTGLEYLAREKDMAVALQARARLYRGREILQESFAEARTAYRPYEEWAADEARPLRTELEQAIARLARDLQPT